MGASDGQASGLPLNGFLAEKLRAGATLDELATTYGVGAQRIRERLNDAGWGQNGQPLSKPVVIPISELFHWPPWVERALCSQTDPEAFFPEKGGSTREAKAVCARCPVQAECVDFALANEERFGIWGGLSERERRKISRLNRNHHQQEPA